MVTERVAPAPTAPPHPDGSSLALFQRTLERYEVTIAEAHDLVALQGYKIVLIADDSGSMKGPAQPKELRQLGVPPVTRWQELGDTLRMVVDIAVLFDEDGVDVHFLNRGTVPAVRSVNDPNLAAALAAPPAGCTPLTQVTEAVIRTLNSEVENPALVIILTDGEPDDGPKKFVKLISHSIIARRQQARLCFQIMACTEDERAVGWLNQLDLMFTEVDVTDDYYSECEEVKKAGRCDSFTRGDWAMKALLGPVCEKFDAWDESAGCCAIL
eukprot:TRINITY_DN25756_c0_g1_i1.p1 TRINITY_DN25756_c0_g1~~TRINITY_DN25756_c0_g1_i1.p1  ORF type:complete len:270 (+),score=77.10 TRINITY_DN25756_c0_g1_i1:67-876(+)